MTERQRFLRYLLNVINARMVYALDHDEFLTLLNERADIVIALNWE